VKKNQSILKILLCSSFLFCGFVFASCARKTDSGGGLKDIAQNAAQVYHDGFFKAGVRKYLGNTVADHGVSLAVYASLGTLALSQYEKIRIPRVLTINNRLYGCGTMIKKHMLTIFCAIAGFIWYNSGQSWIKREFDNAAKDREEKHQEARDHRDQICEVTNENINALQTAMSLGFSEVRSEIGDVKQKLKDGFDLLNNGNEELKAIVEGLENGQAKIMCTLQDGFEKQAQATGQIGEAVVGADFWDNLKSKPVCSIADYQMQKKKQDAVGRPPARKCLVKRVNHVGEGKPSFLPQTNVVSFWPGDATDEKRYEDW